MSNFTLPHDTAVNLRRSYGAEIEQSTIGQLLAEMCERDTFIVNSLGGGYANAVYKHEGRTVTTCLFFSRFRNRRYVTTASGTVVAYMDAANTPAESV
jgi:hypothetical protein